MKISNSLVKKFLENEFSLIAISIEEIRSLPVRNTYIINANNSKVILKIYRREKQEEDIMRSLDIQTFLTNKDFHIPRLIKNNTGKLLNIIEDYIVICQEFIEGEQLRLVEKDIKDFGSFLNKLQKINYKGE
ncbi:MAG TPA: phosphotransferase, partial [Candidatus Dojkabacteria bacterium]|nr:phosphotransferase [Candidatus Dojkabacteria bacterium]